MQKCNNDLVDYISRTNKYDIYDMTVYIFLSCNILNSFLANSFLSYLFVSKLSKTIFVVSFSHESRHEDMV